MDRRGKLIARNAAAIRNDANFIPLQNMTKTVKIIVGNEINRVSYVVHEELLVTKSEVAKTALRPGIFLEGEERLIRWPEEDPKLFHYFIQWIYSGIIATTDINRLLQLYALGERMMSVSFKAGVLAFVKGTHERLDVFQILEVFRNTHEDDTLRLFCINQMAQGVLTGRFKFDNPAECDLLEECLGPLFLSVVTAVAQTKRSAKYQAIKGKLAHCAIPDHHFCDPANHDHGASSNQFWVSGMQGTGTSVPYPGYNVGQTHCHHQPVPAAVAVPVNCTAGPRVNVPVDPEFDDNAAIDAEYPYTPSDEEDLDDE